MSDTETDLPETLKGAVEGLSGMSMSDVPVHRSSNKRALLPDQVHAQGSEIHLAPAQEEHLPHEAWHVVQRQEGRAKPEFSIGGAAVYDRGASGREADVMGAHAEAFPPPGDAPGVQARKSGSVE